MALVSSSTRFPFSTRFIRRSRSVNRGSSRRGSHSGFTLRFQSVIFNINYEKLGSRGVVNASRQEKITRVSTAETSS